MTEYQMDSLIKGAIENGRFGSPDINQVHQVVDFINQNPYANSPIVARIIEKDLKLYEKDPSILYPILFLLETCVKSCGTHFHRAISSPSFLYRIQKTGGLRISNPRRYIIAAQRRNLTAHGHMKVQMQGKVLSLIQCFGPLHPQDLPEYNSLYLKLIKKGVIFPPSTADDEAPFEPEVYNSPPSRRDRTDRLRRMPVIPPDYSVKFEEIKRTVTVLESVLESIKNPEDLCNSEVAQELQTAAYHQKEKLNQDLVEFVSKSPRGEDEKLISIMIMLLERLEFALKNYELLLTGEKVNDFTILRKKAILQRDEYDTESSEEDYSQEEYRDVFENTNPFATGKEEVHAPSAPPINPFELFDHRQPTSNLSNSNKTPWDLGMELIEKIPSVTMKTDSDPFLKWLIDGHNHSMEINSGNPFVSRKESRMKRGFTDSSSIPKNPPIPYSSK